MLKLFALTSSDKVESADFLHGIETHVAPKTSYAVKRGNNFLKIIVCMSQLILQQELVK